jgi:hypothetical protein
MGDLTPRFIIFGPMAQGPTSSNSDMKKSKDVEHPFLYFWLPTRTKCKKSGYFY